MHTLALAQTPCLVTGCSASPCNELSVAILPSTRNYVLACLKAALDLGAHRLALKPCCPLPPGDPSPFQHKQASSKSIQPG